MAAGGAAADDFRWPEEAGSRRADRRRALFLLYESDTRGRDLTAVLAEHRSGRNPPGAYAIRVAAGVAEATETIDRLLGELAEGWPVERMPAVDRALLRMGCWELEATDVPTAVVTDEAVRLAKRFSGEDSPRFVNGVLAAAAERLRPATPPAPADFGADADS